MRTFKSSLGIMSLMLAAMTVTAACAAPDNSAAPPPQVTSPSVAAPPTSPSSTPATTAVPSAPTSKPTPTPPRWLGTRPLPVVANGFGEIRPTPTELNPREFTLPETVEPLPGTGFASKVVSPAPAEVIARSTWKQGCPVPARDLAWIRLSFWGFDNRRHTGELLVNASATSAMVRAFGSLYEQKFPLEEMRVTRAEELDSAPTGDGNNTGAFVCRPAVGSASFSQHAYGLAVDVNPFQNPYTKGSVLVPELASAYLDRDDARPGMLTPQAIAAFTNVGWFWGGAWHSVQDRHHFSANNT